MKFFRTEHDTTTIINGYRSADIEIPKHLPQEVQIFDVEWTNKQVNVTWWIPDKIMPEGGFTEKS